MVDAMTYLGSASSAFADPSIQVECVWIVHDPLALETHRNLRVVKRRLRSTLIKQHG